MIQFCISSNDTYGLSSSNDVSAGSQNTPQTIHFCFQGNLYKSLCSSWRVTVLKAFSRLLQQSSACQASITRRWVVTLSSPRHCCSAAGCPRTPAAPAAVNSYICQKEACFISLWQYLGRFGAKKVKWRYMLYAVFCVRDVECWPFCLWVISQPRPL